MRWPKPYHDACALQRLLMSAAESGTTKPSDLAQVARAWDVLEERKRVMRMKPAPRPIDTTKLATKPTVRPELATPAD